MTPSETMTLSDEKQQSTGLTRYLNLIGGAARPSNSGAWIESIDPATGIPWAEIPAGTPADVDEAVSAAKRAFRGPWSQLTPTGRGNLLRKLAEVVAANAAELAWIETRDNGRILSETSRGDLPFLSMMLQYYAGAADKLNGETLDLGTASFNYIARQAVGVVGMILPWNAPLSILVSKMSAALAAGCTVVVKPPEAAACSILAFGKLIDQAGIPPGVVNIVSGLGSIVGDAMSGHPDIAKITFTGSTATARAITRRSADAIKPLAMELGGKSANIIFADADLDAAAIGATRLAVFTGGAGQACLAGTRILVQRSIHDEFVAKMITASRGIRLGDPMDAGTEMGPIAFDKQYDKVRGYLDLAKTEGAELIMGGRSGPVLFADGSPFGGGYWVEPTLYAGANNQMRIAREEIFGPVAVIIPFDDEEEAISIANDSNYGLVAGIWTQSLKRAHRVTRGIDVGVVWVNSYRRQTPATPFGGVKDSGYGRDSGMESIRSYQYSKSVWIDLN